MTKISDSQKLKAVIERAVKNGFVLEELEIDCFEFGLFKITTMTSFKKGDKP